MFNSQNVHQKTLRAKMFTKLQNTRNIHIEKSESICYRLSFKIIYRRPS